MIVVLSKFADDSGETVYFPARMYTKGKWWFEHDCVTGADFAKLELTDNHAYNKMFDLGVNHVEHLHPEADFVVREWSCPH